MTVIKVVCAWCGKDMGEKDGQGKEGISHGLCEECRAEMASAGKIKKGGIPSKRIGQELGKLPVVK